MKAMLMAMEANKHKTHSEKIVEGKIKCAALRHIVRGFIVGAITTSATILWLIF